jgi:tetratricopeptide (TPR) repeat protein
MGKRRQQQQSPAQGVTPKAGHPGSHAWLVAALMAVVVVIAGVFALQSHDASMPQPVPDKAGTPASADAAPPTHVGSQACAACHTREMAAWRGSHHDLAMQEANERTVLGDFSGARFDYAGITSTFFRRDGAFFVNTDGPDGRLHDYAIQYTFGVTPLQQYLIALDGGRLQALSIAWDSRPKAQGGQRWFHLYPGERITHTDELHWTRRAQNWNHMCAECHSTGLAKNYNAGQRGYRTTWQEINVACEACHGPGSRHVAWAQGTRAGADDGKGLVARLDERRGMRWRINEQTGNAARSTPLGSHTEIEGCARCHSRRSQLFGDYRHGPLMDTHLPVPLREDLYHADGQIQDEVYEYGSFLQSRMYQAGVTCSDCHDPHSLKTRAAGNTLCTQCHLDTKYDTDRHHFHRAGTQGSSCVDCHMPAKNYMVVDPRRDHSFRIPRPEQSARLGTPNACTGCHKERAPAWAAAQLRKWYGHDPQGLQDYAEALHAARGGAADADARLSGLLKAQDQPAIARATAAEELARRSGPGTFDALAAALTDVEPMVRVAALGALQGLPPAQRWQFAHPLLSDPTRAVRMQAGALLADVPAGQLPPQPRAALTGAINEYLTAQNNNADQPDAQVNLGILYGASGDAMRAEQAYRTAIELDPDWIPAYANLADLYREMNRDTEGERVLRTALARQPHAAALHHSLGLLKVRQKDMPAALAALRESVALAPDDARFGYVYAVALHSAGQTREAIRVADAALKRTPGDTSLQALRAELQAPAQDR